MGKSRIQERIVFIRRASGEETEKKKVMASTDREAIRKYELLTGLQSEGQDRAMVGTLAR
jgi:hypothetical protein